LIKLRPIELCIQPAFAQQFLMPAALHDPSPIHDNDQVSVADRRQPVCDDDAGTALHGKIECLLYSDFGF
jgi:hypothetical protein